MLNSTDDITLIERTWNKPAAVTVSKADTRLARLSVANERCRRFKAGQSSSCGGRVLYLANIVLLASAPPRQRSCMGCIKENTRQMSDKYCPSKVNTAVGPNFRSNWIFSSDVAGSVKPLEVELPIYRKIRPIKPPISSSMTDVEVNLDSSIGLTVGLSRQSLICVHDERERLAYSSCAPTTIMPVFSSMLQP